MMHQEDDGWYFSHDSLLWPVGPYETRDNAAEWYVQFCIERGFTYE